MNRKSWKLTLCATGNSILLCISNTHCIRHTFSLCSLSLTLLSLSLSFSHFLPLSLSCFFLNIWIEYLYNISRIHLYVCLFPFSFLISLSLSSLSIYLSFSSSLGRFSISNLTELAIEVCVVNIGNKYLGNNSLQFMYLLRSALWCGRGRGPKGEGVGRFIGFIDNFFGIL